MKSRNGFLYVTSSMSLNPLQVLTYKFLEISFGFSLICGGLSGVFGLHFFLSA